MLQKCSFTIGVLHAGRPRGFGVYISRREGTLLFCVALACETDGQTCRHLDRQTVKDEEMHWQKNLDSDSSKEGLKLRLFPLFRNGNF